MEGIKTVQAEVVEKAKRQNVKREVPLAVERRQVSKKQRNEARVETVEEITAETRQHHPSAREAARGEYIRKNRPEQNRPEQD